MLKTISNDGTTIAYEKKGSGPYLILVLGALNKRGSGKKLTEQLQDHFTVVSYDRRGRGDSTDTPPYSVDKEVEDLDALIEELGGEAFLYGHSSGAILSLLTAARLGDKVKGLALYELPHNEDPEAARTATGYQKELQEFLNAEKWGDAVSLFVKSVGVSDKQIEAMKRLPMWKGLTGMAPTLRYDTIELMNHFPNIDTTSVGTPTLVMYGEASPAFMRETAQKLSETLPDADLIALPGQTHDVKADVLAPELVKFFG